MNPASTEPDTGTIAPPPEAFVEHPKFRSPLLDVLWRSKGRTVYSASCNLGDGTFAIGD